jgi:hypothetical protein
MKRETKKDLSQDYVKMNVFDKSIKYWIYSSTQMVSMNFS